MPLRKVNKGSPGTGLWKDLEMKILIACEYSGVEREAFRARGHSVTSCDLLPADDESPYHYQGDVRDLMYEKWDLVVAHPPCTYLSNSGVAWLYKEPTRWQDMLYGADFFRLMFEFDTPRLCVENPVQHKWAKLAHGMGDPDQTVQPWQFGHPESKRTCYWLHGLPKLTPTNDVKADMDRLPYAESHRLHYLGPSKDRWKLRSVSFSGIAEAMASQWA